MLTALLIVGGLIFFIFCLWAGLLGFFFQLLFSIIGALLGSKSSGSSNKGSFGGGSFGGGGSSDDY